MHRFRRGPEPTQALAQARAELAAERNRTGSEPEDCWPFLRDK